MRIATDLFQGLNCCQTLTAFPLPELPRIIFGFKIKLRLAFIRKGNIYVQVSKAVRRFRAMTYHLRLAFAHLGLVAYGGLSIDIIGRSAWWWC